VLRRQALSRLHDALAKGHLRIGTFEHRVEAALGARSAEELDETTWDLPSERAEACRTMRFGAADALTIDEKPHTWLVGRSRACDVRLLAPSISRRHALVSSRGGACTIRDLGSSNGLFVNGLRVSTAELRPGDQVSFAGAVVAEIR